MNENEYWIKIWKMTFIFFASIAITAIISFHIKGLICMKMGYHEEPVREPNYSTGNFYWVKP